MELRELGQSAIPHLLLSPLLSLPSCLAPSIGNTLRTSKIVTVQGRALGIFPLLAS